MWPLLKKSELKHYSVNNIQSLIYTQMYNRFNVIEKGELWVSPKFKVLHVGVSQGYPDQLDFFTLTTQHFAFMCNRKLKISSFMNETMNRDGTNVTFPWQVFDKKLIKGY